jgi:hypothetical protein
MNSQSRNVRFPTCGCLVGLAILMFICVAFIALPEIREANALNAGTRAFKEGDCKEAIKQFDDILNGFDWGIVNAGEQVEQPRLECIAFLEAVEEENAQRFGWALARFIDFPSIYPNSDLNNHIPARVAALFGKVSAEELAIREVCDRVALLGESNMLPRPEDQLPELYYYCGHTYESTDDLENAIIMYYMVKTDYPDHYLVSKAIEGLARVEIELAKLSGAGSIAQPQQSGQAPYGTSVYVVRNDSSEKIQLVLSGPEVLIEEIAACTTCTEFTSAPESCPEKGPQSRYTLKPGTYDVLVKSISDEAVTPYHGTWTFESGAEYSECYYIVTTP